MPSRFRFFDIKPDPEKWRRRNADKMSKAETTPSSKEGESTQPIPPKDNWPKRS